MAIPEFEKFRILRKICKKYCFTLYEAEDLIEGRKRFLKVLDENLANEAITIFNFLNSARMTSLLNNDHICKVHYYGRENDHFVIASEAIDSNTLTVLIHEEFPVSLEKTVELVIKIARILRDAHLRGVVHGLLNPSSIYVSNENHKTVKLDDFGYSWLVPRLNEIDEAEAKYLSYHISPEVYMSSEKIDGRADVYSLGVILLQILTNCIPFNEVDNSSHQNQLLKESLRTLHKVLPAYPKRLDKIILQTLHKNPDQRFLNMKEFEKELQLLKSEYLSQSKANQKNEESFHS